MNLLKEIDFMNVLKELKEIDCLYQTTISFLPTDQKISYCEGLIDKAQYNLIRNKKLINEDLENQLYTLILAARTELNTLNSEK